MVVSEIHVTAEWDPASRSFHAYSAEVPGLSLSAPSLDALAPMLRVAVPVLVDRNRGDAILADHLSLLIEPVGEPGREAGALRIDL